MWVSEDTATATLMHLELMLSAGMIGGYLKAVVEPYLQERASARFAGEGDDVVGKWSPLKPATVAIRQHKGFPGEHPINVRTGELEQYVTGDPGFVAPDPFGATLTWPGDPQGAELEHKVQVAQVGEDRTIPRPVIGVNERDLMFVLASLSMLFAGPQASVVSVEGGTL
jgi:hypothetical protein